jgi:hypothetical protein
MSQPNGEILMVMAMVTMKMVIRAMHALKLEAHQCLIVLVAETQMAMVGQIPPLHGQHILLERAMPSRPKPCNGAT